MNVIRINTESLGTFDCKTSYYYALDGNSGTRSGNGGPKAYNANSTCGGTVSVN